MQYRQKDVVYAFRIHAWLDPKIDLAVLAVCTVSVEGFGPDDHLRSSHSFQWLGTDLDISILEETAT